MSEPPTLWPIPPLPSEVGHVYALMMPQQTIKIGWTGRLPHLRAAELGGRLLAYTYGTLTDEADFHRKLLAFRIGRTEDFWPTPDVWAAVELIQLDGDFQRGRGDAA